MTKNSLGVGSEALNIIGVRFSKLTVTERLENRHGKPYWKCICDCGNETGASGANLKNNAVKSCGCWIGRNRVSKYCIICNKEVLIKKSHVDKEGKYCSLKCRNEGFKEQFIGEDNPNYRHGLAYTLEYKRPYVKAWHEANPDKVKEFNRNAKARRMLATGTHTAEDIEQKRLDQFNSCYWCFEWLECFEVDHIIPLSKGGSNCKDNVVVSCGPCNRQKHAMFVHEWFNIKNCRAKRQKYDTGRLSEVWK